MMERREIRLDRARTGHQTADPITPGQGRSWLHDDLSGRSDHLRHLRSPQQCLGQRPDLCWCGAVSGSFDVHHGRAALHTAGREHVLAVDIVVAAAVSGVDRPLEAALPGRRLGCIPRTSGSRRVTTPVPGWPFSASLGQLADEVDRVRSGAHRFASAASTAVSSSAGRASWSSLSRSRSATAAVVAWRRSTVVDVLIVAPCRAPGRTRNGHGTERKRPLTGVSAGQGSFCMVRDTGIEPVSDRGGNTGCDVHSRHLTCCYASQYRVSLVDARGHR